MIRVIKKRIYGFLSKEGITLRKLLNVSFVIGLLVKYRYIHFFVVGITGAGVALLIIYGLTEYVFGREKYYTAYLIGLAVNLIYNFVLHTLISFKTKSGHFYRFIVFVVYNLLMASLQAFVVNAITPMIGVDFYIFIIASVIFLFSIVNYFVFKLVVFFEADEHRE